MVYISDISEMSTFSEVGVDRDLEDVLIRQNSGGGRKCFLPIATQKDSCITALKPA